MGATIQKNERGHWVMRISGALRKEELDAIQAEVVGGLTPDEKAKVLVRIEDDFAGWVGGEVWHDMTFMVEHGDRIGKIAIVSDPKWEGRMLMFAGAGVRRTPVKYFNPNQLPEAQAWLG